MALATYLVLDSDDRQPAAGAARTAGKCVRSGKPREICIKDYAHALERRYRAKFAALPANEQQLAYRIAIAAVRQIGQHEYAHHLLLHWDRIASGSIARIDAEFEADFYAVLNAIQRGDNPSAMFYFFDVLAAMGDQSKAMQSLDYESGGCRADNINNITGTLGAAPMMLVKFASGGSLGDVTPEVDFPKFARELAEGVAPRLLKSCGRLSEAILREARAELASLTALMAEYAHLFPKRVSKLELDEPEVFTLIERLQEQASSFKHIKGLAAGVLSHLVLRVGLGDAQAKVSRQLDAVLESTADDILSVDYGRFLSVKALHVLHDTDGPAATRIDAAKTLFESAVTFYPYVTESWLNLAMIAYVKGDCRKAAELADKAARIANDETAERARSMFRNKISNPKRCAEDGARFVEEWLR
jgi:tetratricopeptide (TPR) repeat protein